MRRTGAALALGLSLSGGAAAETLLVIPAAANASGRGGAAWKTTLELVNPSKVEAVDVSVAFLAAGADNRAAREATVRVPAGRGLVLPDVVGTLLSSTGGGALRLRSSSLFHAVSRTETPRAGARPAGVEVPAAGEERASTGGLLFPLANRSGANGVRSNVGFVNPGDAAVAVSYDLYDGARVRVGGGSVSLPPRGFAQVNDVLGAAGAAVDDARLEYRATGAVHAFGVVLSNESGEGSYVAGSPNATAVLGLAVRPVTAVTRVPDSTYATGDFCRLARIPGTDRLVLTFGTGDYTKVGPAGCAGAGMGYAWKELNQDLSETGRHGMFRSYPSSCAAGDAASVLVGSDYYFLTGDPRGLSLSRYDVATFAKKGEVAIPLTPGREASNDQMLAWVDGRLDASALLAPSSNAEVDPFAGFGTYHRFFSADLVALGSRDLTDPPHINGSSMLFLDGTYHLVTSTAFFGDLVALRYDAEFRPIGRTVLASRGQWSQGAAWDGERFWVTWVDVGKRGTANIVLGAFDRDWNPVARVPVTAFTAVEGTGGGRPALLLWDDRVYVSYDVDEADPATHEEKKRWECRVSVYDVER